MLNIVLKNSNYAFKASPATKLRSRTQFFPVPKYGPHYHISDTVDSTSKQKVSFIRTSNWQLLLPAEPTVEDCRAIKAFYVQYPIW